MGNIVLLDDLTINKIAAGEVIERPASVVKELVENSIDAGATNISIETRNGGISYIRITDNGKGFLPDDMEIAFERHATSKIRKAEDLETVKSMGFRGEALASIAAISRVELISKTEENSVGYKIVVEGGKILSKEEIGCPKGTTITVENLFFNTPVRYKFLKKDFTEAGYIEDAVTRIALVNPNIGIRLISSGKTIIQTTGNGDSKSVIYNIYGKDIAENILNVDYTYDDIRITGVVGKPVIARSNRSNQLFFVNKRFIKDKALTSSAEQAFKGMLTIGKYGFLILNIEIDPHKVDVNVHPAKLEVRFEEESKVFKAVYHAIKETLLQSDLVRETEKNYKEDRSEEKVEVKKEESVVNNIVNNNDEKKSSIEKLESINPAFASLFKKIISDNSASVTKSSEEKIQHNIIEDIYSKKNDAKEEKVSIDTLNNKEAEKIVAKEEIKNDLNKEENKDDKNEKEVNIENKKEDINKIDETIDVKEDVNIPDQIIGIKNENIEKNEEITNKEFEPVKEEDMQNILKQINALKENKMEADDKNFDEMYAKMFGKLPMSESKVEDEGEKYKIDDSIVSVPTENISIFNDDSYSSIPNYKFIGIAFSTYIIIEMDKEMYIIDQHAAHERIMYEKIKKNYYSDGPKESQLMLLPDIITLTHKEMGIAKDNMQLFEKAGFTLEEFGENTIKISGVPNICIDLETKELFLETLDEINTVARTAKQEIEEKFIATLACKSAVKANMALTKQEVDNLMRQLLVLPNPFTCPHGRPTAIKMSKIDIEKKFSRR
ncbi:dNA mismatch repair protein MutL [Clostridium sp. CAG:571]|jgi:DNA mismatch repair protein MutL|nr:dNA mismatch repair protein MutL [Clostridium sp. CAG:571]